MTGLKLIGMLIQLILFSNVLFAKNFTEGSLKIKDLRCEYAVNPIGIDVQNPRFSWILESGMRAQAQTAFQVIVAKDIESLGKHRGDKWDSGKIMSNNSVNIPYEGGMLMSGEKCFWKVRVWDNEGNVSTWAQPVSFEMGILADNDWGGKWIGNRIFNELNYSEGKTGKAGKPASLMVFLLVSGSDYFLPFSRT